MALRSDWSQATCPIARGVNVLGDPWVLLILREVFLGASRFEELRRRVKITDRTLSDRLAAMVVQGLLAKTAAAASRSRYTVTDMGADTLPVLHAYALWAQKHRPHMAGASWHIVCRACAAASGNADMCGACGNPLDAANVTWSIPVSTGNRDVELVAPGETEPPAP